jgi:hypothetical protein
MHVSTRSEVSWPHLAQLVPIAIRTITVRAFGALRAKGSALIRWARNLSPEQMFWFAMALLALMYLLILMGVPTSAGRANQ